LSVFLLALGQMTATDAFAIIRGQSAGTISRHVVRLNGPGYFCSATVIGRQEVLTAGHCVNEVGSLSIIAGGQRIAVTGHSGFGGATQLTLARPLPASFTPIAFGSGSGPMVIAGYGISYESARAQSAGLREARLVSQSGYSYGPLVDPNRRGDLGASACMGDSGGPVAQLDGGRYVLVGIVDRASHPSPSRACGYLTHFVSVGGSWFGASATETAPPRRAVNVKQKKMVAHDDTADRRDYR
jgi:hypothetical protein